jgi:hypothetical protein
MKYGTVIRLLTAACVVIVQLTGCSPDTEDMKRSVTGIPIRIVAEMNKGTGASRMTKTPVRSGGEWKENYIGAEEYEKTVKHVLLFAYKNIGTSPEKVIFYYPQGTANPLVGITGIDHFEMREMGGINVGDSDIALDLELMGGNYNFVLLVNCESGLKKIREEHMIPDPRLLTEKTEIFTSDDLQGENRKYLPMVGQCNFHVPDNMGGNDRVTLSPSILLERTHARIEFILTTVDDAGNYLSPLLPLSRVTKLSLNNETSGYSVLPSAGLPPPVAVTRISGGWTTREIPCCYRKGPVFTKVPTRAPENPPLWPNVKEGCSHIRERHLAISTWPRESTGKRKRWPWYYPSITGRETPMRRTRSSSITRILGKMTRHITISVVIPSTVSSPR